MSAWLKAVWLPAVIAAVSPISLLLAVRAAVEFEDTYQFLAAWSCCVGGCAFAAGWRVANGRCGRSWAASGAGLVVLVAGAWPLASILGFVLTAQPPDLVAGQIFMSVVVGASAFGAALLGWVGGAVAVRWGPGHAT